MTMQTEKVRKPTGVQIDRERLLEIVEKMRSWNELSEDISGQLPAAVVAALSAGRPQLAKLALEPGTDPQTATLIRLVAVLLETNDALRMHAEEIASRVRTLENNLKGVLTGVKRIDDFANFRMTIANEDE